MQKKKIWLTFSAVLVAISIVLLAVWGLKPGLDFTGGSLLEIKFLKDRPQIQEINSILAPLRIDGGFVIQPIGEDGTILRFKEASEETHQAIWNALKEKYGDNAQEERFESIGPAIGKELKTRAVYAIILVNIAIIAYLAWSFRKVSWQVASWKYGLAAVIALIHDITITVGIFCVLGRYLNVEVGLPFVAALLTILGYSVNDTIVVFDRIRENLGKLSKITFEDLVNRSINETIRRSINTSLTVMIALISVFVFGGESIKYFALALIIGVAFGTYSSIFLASPLMVLFAKYGKK